MYIRRKIHFSDIKNAMLHKFWNLHVFTMKLREMIECLMIELTNITAKPNSFNFGHKRPSFISQMEITPILGKPRFAGQRYAKRHLP